jgi:hypothetical protein
LAIGSPTATNTMGITDVACINARTDGVPDVTMASTLSRTNSAANSANRSRPSAQRYSMATVLPTIHRSSPNRRAKATTFSPAVEGVAEPKNPIVGSLAGCSARVAIGHVAAAPPRRR